MTAIRRYWLFLLAAIIGLVPILAAVGTSGTVGAFEQIRAMAPWNAARPEQPFDVLQADSALQFAVWRELVLESWGRFEIPFWNPYELGGTLLLANSQSGALYPFHILFGILHVPTGLAINLLAVLHLAISAFGAARLTRVLGGNELGQSVCAVSFGGSAFMLAWTALPSVISTVAWIPLGLSIVLERDSSVTSAIKLAGVTACMFLAGHLQFVAYGAIALCVCLVAVGWRDRFGAWPKLVGLVLGVVLALPQLLPVLDYSQYSHRRAPPTAEGFAAYNASALQPYHLASLASPVGLGNPRVNGPQISDGVFVSEYWPAIAHRGMNYAEGALTLGPLALAFLCFAPFRKRTSWPMLGLGVVSLLMAFGSPVNAFLYFNVPGWSATGSPGRSIILFVLAGSVLAGLGASQFTQATKRPIVGMAGVLLGLGFIPILAPSGIPPEAPAAVSELAQTAIFSALMTSLPVVAIVLILCLVLSLPEEKLRVHGALGLCLLCAVVSPFTFNPIMSGRFDFEAPSADPGTTRVAIVNRDWDLLTAAPALYPPNMASRHHILELGGYDSLIHRDTVGILNQINGQDSAPPANGNMMFVKPDASKTKLQEAGVTEVWTRSEDGSTRKEEIGGNGLAEMDGSSVQVQSVSPTSVKLRVSRSGKLVVKFRNVGHFTSNIGSPEVSSLWLEFDVPEGVTNVEIRPTHPLLPSPTVPLLLTVVILGCLLVRRGKYNRDNLTNPRAEEH